MTAVTALAATAALAACEKGRGTPSGGPGVAAPGIHGTGNGGGKGGSGGAGGSGGVVGGGGAGGTAACFDAGPLEYDANGCLTLTSTSALCGFDSDGSVCAFAVNECVSSTDVGQCWLDCELSASNVCITASMVGCLVQKYCAHSCTIVACGIAL